jgi:putative membrane protein
MLLPVFCQIKLATVISLRLFLIAGLILAIINTFIRPIIVILSLPAIVLSLGLFMVVVNGLTVYLASWLYKPLNVTNFGLLYLPAL